jgi:glycosyltransferase involved in cell wall biosynthesis
MPLLTQRARLPIQVLHVHTRLIRGGADENTLLTVNGLDPRRYRVALAVGAGSEAAMLAKVASHVRLIEIPDMIREISPGHDLRAFQSLRRTIRAERFHIVHTHTAKAGILGRFAARAAGKPLPSIVHTLHGSTFHDALGRAAYVLYWGLEKAAAVFTDRIISVGEDLRARYLQSGVGRPGQYRVIRSGMGLTEFAAASNLGAERRAGIRRSLGVPADVPLVGKVARLERRKGHQYFLDMAELILRRVPDAHFIGLGAGVEHTALIAEVERRGLAGRVLFPGFRPDIAEVLAVMDVVVLTSLWEGLPRVLVQAAACGVPAVTFAVEGAREIIHDGVNGWVVPIRDVNGLSDRVAALLSDPDRARAMGAAGRALVRDAWTVESMIRDIAALYEELVGRASLAEAGEQPVMLETDR